MLSTLKRHKYSEQQSGRPFEDRISHLPSSILGDILSLLPTKDAVATSVLSTTWKEMWTLVTRLDLSDDYLLQSPTNSVTCESLQAKFVNFVYRVLVLGRFSHITSFVLSCNRSYDPLFINASLVSVLKYSKVEKLCISVPLRNSMVLPISLFISTTLVELKLGENIVMNVPCRVYLPCLKRINLDEVRFPDGDAITRFFGGCPVLDRLTMRKCLGRNVEVVKICLPSLTFLELEFLRIDEESVLHFLDDRNDDTFRIVLDAPLVSQIFIHDCVPEGYLVLTSPLQKLRAASLSICGPLDSYTMKSVYAHQDIHRVAISDLLMGMSKVEKLFISYQDIGRCLLPTFENLRKLSVGDRKNLTLGMMIKLLESAPNLVSFMPILSKHENGDTRGNTEEFRLPEKIPSCLLSHLEIIQIKEFVESPKNFEVLRYFLKNAQVMKLLVIECTKRRFLSADLLRCLQKNSSSAQCPIEIRRQDLSEGYIVRPQARPAAFGPGLADRASIS